MRVQASTGQADLTYVLLSDAEVALLAEVLRKPEKKLPAKAKTLAHDLRVALREVGRGG